MLLRDIITRCGPFGMLQDPYKIAARVEIEWKGARVYMTSGACKTRWLRDGRAPTGAAERLAKSIEDAVIAERGTHEQVARILVTVMGQRIDI